MSELHFKSIQNASKQRAVKIGIGSAAGSSRINESIDRLESDNNNISVASYSKPEELINDLVKGEIEGAVRGNLSSSEVIGNLRKAFQIEDLMRVNFLKTAGDIFFLMAPVGIDEGGTTASKIELVKLASSWLELFFVDAKIAVLSGGRPEDLGRSVEVDATLRTAEDLTNELTNMGFVARNFGILIEDAIKESSLVIVPNGIIGNFIFRTLHHLGGGESIGAPILNLSEIFVDTSRTKEDYSSALILAAAMVNIRALQKSA